MENELQIESHAHSIYRPSDGIQLSPFVRHHNSQFSILNYYISTLEKGVGQIRLLFLHCEGKSAALSLEGLTVGALIHRWISLVRANGNAVQRTVRSGRTMVCALLHRAVDRLVAAIVTHRE